MLPKYVFILPPLIKKDDTVNKPIIANTASNPGSFFDVGGIGKYHPTPVNFAKKFIKTRIGTCYKQKRPLSSCFTG